MRVLLWLLALFGLAVGISLAFGFNEGFALFVLPPWRVELTLNLFLALAIGGFLLGYLLLRLAAHALRLPRAVRAHRERKRREKAAAALREAALQFFAGRFGHALKNAIRAHEGGEAPALAALLAARAAHALRDEAREAEWLARAATGSDEPAARLMTEAELHLDARRFDAALASLDALQAGGGRHIAALRLALRAYRGLGRWEDVLKVARQLEKHRALTAEAAQPLKQRAHLESLRQREGDAAALAAWWQAVPAAERLDARLAAAAARALIAAGDGARAQHIIEQQLEAAWDSELAGLYAECRGGDALARIARAEKWLEQQPWDARLLLALGRLCGEQQLWGKAQSYFEASLALRPGQEAWLELAALFDRLGREADAGHAWREAAKAAAPAAPQS
ncbi:MAG TPA: heme biosynthesis HemY N-terminal domain-containing protein [Candidatus Desulfobacillus sp.]|nr:heme biosynthesis HemY N-terminal domain-containing protein [Candidatus Desulfobacillus sp.]